MTESISSRLPQVAKTVEKQLAIVPKGLWFVSITKFHSDPTYLFRVLNEKLKKAPKGAFED